MIRRLIFLIFIGLFSIGQTGYSQGGTEANDHSNDHQKTESSAQFAYHKGDHSHDKKGDHAESKNGHACHPCKDKSKAKETKKIEPYDPAYVALHHIADANVWLHFLGIWNVPLPTILYSKDAGLSTFMSSKFKYDYKGNGSKAIDRYILSHGVVMRISDESFPSGEVKIDCISHDDKGHYYAVLNGTCYEAHDRSVFDAGLVGGGLTSYYDFSLTKNVLTMLFAFALLAWIFISAARAYRKYDKEAPQGFWQRVLEPVFIFMRDEVCKPVIGHDYERFMPFIMSLFFFILGLNLVGQIPFIGNPNVTGNIAFTAVLAIFTLIVTSINGNKHYWQHIFWMPGVPAAVKVILTPIEVLGIFLKPLTLLVRLFANITAGHIIILSFVGLIFIFGDIGLNDWGIGYGGGNIIGLIMAVALTLFMSAIELLVAFLQAFIFAILSASYIGAAIADDHH